MAEESRRRMNYSRSSNRKSGGDRDSQLFPKSKIRRATVASEKPTRGGNGIYGGVGAQKKQPASSSSSSSSTTRGAAANENFRISSVRLTQGLNDKNGGGGRAVRRKSFESVESGDSGYSESDFTYDTYDSRADDNSYVSGNERTWGRYLVGKKKSGRGERRSSFASMMVIVVLAALGWSVAYKFIFLEGSHGSAIESFGRLFRNPDGRGRAEPVEPEPVDEPNPEWGLDTQLRYRTLPQGGSIVEMVSNSQSTPRDKDESKKETVVISSSQAKQNAKSELQALRDKNRLEHLENWKD